MRIFRFSFLLPSIIIITVVWIFFAFYLDTLLKKALISTGQAIFNAKVEVGSLKTTFTKFSVNINNLKIGDKDNEFKNIADIDNINFKMRFIPLLSKKFIIDNMSIDGFKWGTARTTSAKLPPSKKKKSNEESVFTKAFNTAKDKAVSEFEQFEAVKKIDEIKKLSKNFSAENAIDLAGIKSVTAIKEQYENLSKKYETYNGDIKNIDTQKQVSVIKELTDKISKTKITNINDASELKQNITDLNTQKKELEKTYNNFKTMQKELVKDISGSKNLIGSISDSINNDVNDILSKMQVPSLGSDDSIKMLLGNVWVDRIHSVLYYMNLIKKYMPEKSSKKAEPAPIPTVKMIGKNITYPIKGALPKLWIANISISANSGGEGKEGTVVFYKGSIKNITSNQTVIGKNTVFELLSDDKKQVFKITGIFDRLKDVAEDKISFSANGISAKMLNIPDSPYTPSFNNAETKLNADFTLKGPDFITSAKLNIYSFSYDAKNSIDAMIAKYISLLWKGINSMNVSAQFAILKDEGLKTSFSSDIGKLLAKRFDDIIKSELGDMKNKIREQVVKYIDEQSKVYKDEAEKYQQEIQKVLEDNLKGLKGEIDIVDKLSSGKTKELKNLANKQVTDAVGSALKGLF
jgi:uncharacterized protein (TIGR03545 family)